MKIFHILTACFFIFALEAHPVLHNLLDYDKTTCLEILENTETPELWDAFLEGQVNYFFDKEMQLLEKTGDWWQDATTVLDLGCGNGIYLNTLREHFGDKSYLGVDKSLEQVELARGRFQAPQISFEEGDAEVKNDNFREQFDVVIFRLTLLHLKDPRQALKNAYSYLKPSGHVIIVDAYDLVRESSHSIFALDEIFQELNGAQNTRSNRRASFELFREVVLQQSCLSDLFEASFSNLNPITGKLDYETRFEGPEDRKLCFNHGLLFLNVVHKLRGIPVDFDRAYDELKAQALDPTSWQIPGFHFLILKKI